MFTIMQPTTPFFSFCHDASIMSPPHYRPAVPSPLSSPPMRAASASPPAALAPRDPNAAPRLRDTQSSPITAKQQFKYAARNPRPNPVVKRREDAQESRRRLFLQNVRQRADDKKWEKRGGENELLKLEWCRINRELQQARESNFEPFVTEEEIEDEPLPELDDADSLMLDAIEREEEAEIDALLSAIPETQSSTQKGPEANHFSDDDEYDEIFMEFLSEQDGERITRSQDMDMS